MQKNFQSANVSQSSDQEDGQKESYLGDSLHNRQKGQVTYRLRAGSLKKKGVEQKQEEEQMKMPYCFDQGEMSTLSKGKAKKEEEIAQSISQLISPDE